MKKVICILMMVVLVAIANITVAEKNPTNYEAYEVVNMVEDWAEAQKLNEKYSWNLENGTYYCMGAISETEFKELSGMEFSTDNLEKIYYNCKNYGQDYDVTNCNVRTTGFCEGYNVYIMDISTNNVPLGTTSGIDYYNVSIIFMIGR